MKIEANPYRPAMGRRFPAIWIIALITYLAGMSLILMLLVLERAVDLPWVEAWVLGEKW
jgi:hypothetical protein